MPGGHFATPSAAPAPAIQNGGYHYDPPKYNQLPRGHFATTPAAPAAAIHY